MLSFPNLALNKLANTNLRMFCSLMLMSAVQYNCSTTKYAKALNKFVRLPESAENHEYNQFKQVMA